MANNGNHSSLTIYEKNNLILETINYLDSVWAESLQPLIPLPFKSQLTGETVELEPYDYELKTEYPDTMSVMRAILINFEEIFSIGKLQTVRKNELQNIAGQVVAVINNQIKSDPREPDTERLKELLLDEYVSNDDKQAYICEESIPLKITTYLKSDEKYKEYVFGEIDAIIRESGALMRRNKLITSLWLLPIEDLYDGTSLEKEEDLLDGDYIDGEVVFYGPNKSWKKENDGKTDEERRLLPLSESEKYFEKILPSYLIGNIDLMPHEHIGDIFDPATHTHILNKVLLRKTIISLYAENHPKRKKRNKKLQEQYRDSLENLSREIAHTKHSLERGD